MNHQEINPLIRSKPSWSYHLSMVRSTRRGPSLQQMGIFGDTLCPNHYKLYEILCIVYSNHKGNTYRSYTKVKEEMKWNSEESLRVVINESEKRHKDSMKWTKERNTIQIKQDMTEYWHCNLSLHFCQQWIYIFRTYIYIQLTKLHDAKSIHKY
jgi:hypothetical protein